MRRAVTLASLACMGVLIVSALAIAVVMLRSDGPASAAVIAQRAEQEKQAILSAMSQGQILYFKAEELRSQTPAFLLIIPWVHPGRIVPSDGGWRRTPTGWQPCTRGPPAPRTERFWHTQSCGPIRTCPWVATGEQIIQPYEYTPNQLSGWVRGIWARESSLLAKGHGRIGSGTLSGQASAIFEMEVETSANFTPAEMREMHISPDQLPAPVTRHHPSGVCWEKPLRCEARCGSGTGP